MLISAGQKLGRTSGQQVRLAALRANGYTRTLAGSGYLRVNPFEVELGQAADPDDGVSGLHSLLAWVGYTHASIPAGSELTATPGYGTVTLNWTRPNGYTRAPSILEQRIFVKDTGESTINATALAVNPFDSPDQSQAAGDGTSDVVNVASYQGSVIAIGVKAEFDDSVTVHVATDGNGYTGAVGEDLLLGAGAGIAIQVMAGNPGPISVTQTTDPDTCTVGDNVNLRIDVNMQGPSLGTLQEQVNGGAWTTIDSGVAAGTLVINRSVQSGNNYRYRLRYNDVSPDDWATQTGTVSAVCNLL